MRIDTHGPVLARFGHALSDPTRARVLLTLQEQPGYPSDLADRLGVSRQSLSNHLTCLRGSGLVVAVPEGRRTRYELADPRLAHALTDLMSVALAVSIGPDDCATTRTTTPTRTTAPPRTTTPPPTTAQTRNRAATSARTRPALGQPA